MTRASTFKPLFKIEGHKVGEGERCFVIAEAGVNHNGDLALAKRLIEIGKKACADAVKFQTFKAEKVVSPHAQKARYQIETTGPNESQHEMIKKLELSFQQFRELHRHARKVGIIFLSTPFDQESVDFLEELGIAAFKVASGEITNLDFIKYVAKKRKPVILSTGMSTLKEVRAAVKAVQASGNRELALLHCVSNYPAATCDINLRAMETMRNEFACPVGYSDHTLGAEAAIAAVALGAKIIEKHLTLDNSLPGPDQRASMQPDEFAAMVKSIRNVESALGDGLKRPARSEAGVAAAGRRSLVAATNISAGSVLRETDIAVLRPGTGLPPAMRSRIAGRRARRAIAAGEVLSLEMLK